MNRYICTKHSIEVNQYMVIGEVEICRACFAEGAHKAHIDAMKSTPEIIVEEMEITIENLCDKLPIDVDEDGLDDLWDKLPI